MNRSNVAYTPSVSNKVQEQPLNGEVQPQNFKTGRVYVFGKDDAQCLGDDEEEDTGLEMGKIRARKAKNGHKDEEKASETQKVKIIHRQVFPNDTLSKFALQYGCTVSDIILFNILNVSLLIPHQMRVNEVWQVIGCISISYDGTENEVDIWVARIGE